MPDYIDTYYRRTLAFTHRRPPLQGDLTADAAIVGGGLAGLTCALELARRGRGVVVLEAARIAWGASGRNGGFVSPGYSAGHQHIARRVGADHAKELHRLSIEGARAVAANLSTLEVTDAGRVDGILSTS